MSPVREEPDNLVERATQAAMDAVGAVLGEAGASVGTLYIALHAHDTPSDEEDAVAAASGKDLPEDFDLRKRDVLAFLVSEAAQVGREIGLDVRIVPLPKMGQG